MHSLQRGISWRATAPGMHGGQILQEGLLLQAGGRPGRSSISLDRRLEISLHQVDGCHARDADGSARGGE
jgi:hypothetical protein